ncbi:MAG: hypothetical protein ACLQUY_04855 [Ktedonobacterales bacterium]
MPGLLSVGGAQLPFDEATEQAQEPLPVGRRQLVPAAAAHGPRGRGGALDGFSDWAGTRDMAHQLPVEHTHNPAGRLAIG